MCQTTYDQIIANRTSHQSKVSLQTIENITKLFTNFAKYGCVKSQPNSPYKQLRSHLNLSISENQRTRMIQSLDMVRYKMMTF